MKKLLKKINLFITALFLAVTLFSCGTKAEEEIIERDPIQSINSFKVIAQHKVFEGTISDSAITISLPANIDSWTDKYIEIRVDYGETFQINGAGETYDLNSSQKILFTSFSDIKTLVLKQESYTDIDLNKTTVYKDKIYQVKVEKCVVPAYDEKIDASDKTVYKLGDKIKLPEEYVNPTGTYYNHKQLGWSASKTAEYPEYTFEEEVTVTDEMLNAGIANFYRVWSKYEYSELVENVTDINGKKQKGYVAYILSKNDSFKAESSASDKEWTYIIVSQYGDQRLSDVTWENAKTGLTNTTLPNKAEMEQIIANIWETTNSANRQWKIFGNGTLAPSTWTNFWTSTEKDDEKTKAYYAEVTTNSSVTGGYAGHVSSTKEKTSTANAIGISYIK